MATITVPTDGGVWVEALAGDGEIKLKLKWMPPEERKNIREKVDINELRETKLAALKAAIPLAESSDDAFEYEAEYAAVHAKYVEFREWFVGERFSRLLGVANLNFVTEDADGKKTSTLVEFGDSNWKWLIENAKDLNDAINYAFDDLVSDRARTKNWSGQAKSSRKARKARNR